MGSPFPFGELEDEMTATADVLEEYLESTADRRMASYEAFLRIPSV